MTYRQLYQGKYQLERENRSIWSVARNNAYMNHAQSGFWNNEFKALRENPFVFLKLAFRPNHQFSHAPFSPPTKVLLSTQLLCTMNTPAKRHPLCEDIISLFTFEKVPSYYSTSIWWQNTFLWPFLFSSLLFYNYRHQIHLFSFFFSTCVHVGGEKVWT